MGMNRQRERGFTLVELIVVLALLAIFATMALTATSGITDQTRYERTIRTFDDIELAIFGDPHSSGPAYGFLADMGRFPTKSTTWVTAIPDLFQVGTLLAHDAPMNQSLAQAKFLCGWNGPYLRTPPNSPTDVEIKDGWGNPIAFIYDSAVKKYRIRSSGADGILENSDDLFRDFYDDSYLYGRVHFLITNNTGGDIDVKICVYHPADNGFEKIWYDGLVGQDHLILAGKTMDEIFSFDLEVTAGIRSMKVDGGDQLTAHKVIRVVGGGVTTVNFIFP